MRTAEPGLTRDPDADAAVWGRLRPVVQSHGRALEPDGRGNADPGGLSGRCSPGWMGD